MHRFWIVLPVALALAAPAAYAGKLDSIEKAAKTLVAKKETRSSGGGFHSFLGGNNSHGKAGGILSKGKKLLGR